MSDMSQVQNMRKRLQDEQSSQKTRCRISQHSIPDKMPALSKDIPKKNEPSSSLQAKAFETE